MILVIGATSLLGRAVVSELVAAGQTVRASYRSPGQVDGFLVQNAEVVALDLLDPDTFGPALQGIDAVFTSTHSLTARRSSAIQHADIDGYKALINSAAKHGIGRFVFTSAMGACLDHPAPFWRAKAAVEQHLVASGLPYTILRPSAFMDFHAHQMIGERVLAGKPARILGAGKTRRNLVAVGDVAALGVRALLSPEFTGRVVDIGGPDNLSDLEVSSLYARLAGVPLKVQALPPSALTVLATLAKPFHAGAANILRLPLTMDRWPDLTFDASGVPALIGRPPITLENFARSKMAAAGSANG
jgi:NADH dehydrogenase